MTLHPFLNPPPSARQIVYCQRSHGRLYGEMIQVMAERDRCWIRPLVYVASDEADRMAGDGPPRAIEDLRCGPDLICPLGTFQPALDQDWLAIAPLLSRQDGPDPGSEAQPWDRAAVQARLHALLRELTDRYLP